MITIITLFGCFFYSLSLGRIDGYMEKQETHVLFSDMERYVYDNVGEGVYFDKPKIDCDNMLITLFLVQNENDYIAERFDMTRCLINEYLDRNPEFFLNQGFKIKLSYNKRVLYGGNLFGDYCNEEIGCACNNYFLSQYETVNDTESLSVEFDDLSAVFCYEGYYYRSCYGLPGIRLLFVGRNAGKLSHDDVLMIISEMTDLEFLILLSYYGDMDELIEDAHGINPNVELYILYNSPM